MKRPAAGSKDRPAKKTKLGPSEDLFSEKFKRNAGNLLEEEMDGTGFIVARTQMIWPVGKHLRISAQVQVNGRIRCMELVFTGGCAEWFQKQNLHFDALDEFHLALKGATIVKRPPSGNLNALPFLLRYTEGAIVKFVKSKRWHDEEHIVDTWKLKANTENEEDWFKTPSPGSPSPDICMNRNNQPLDATSSQLGQSADEVKAQVMDGSLPSPPTTSRATTPSPLSTKETTVPITTVQNTRQPKMAATLPEARSNRVDSESKSSNLGRAATSKPEHFQQRALGNDDERKLTKKQKRKLRKKAQRERDQVEAMANLALDSASVTVETISQNTEPPPEHIPNEPEVPEEPPTPSSCTPSSSDRKTASAVVSHPLLRIRVGFTNENGQRYPPLASINSANTYIYLAGVVYSMSAPARTSKGDWTCSFSIVDPSLLTPEDLSVSDEFKITCFTAKYQEWLPAAAKFGDIIILQQVKTTEFSSRINGVGYKDRLQWAIYSPSNGISHHGDLNPNVPVSEAPAGGFGYSFSPFYKPTPNELAYCKQLGDWWTEVQKERQKTAPNEDLSEQYNYVSAHPRRQHRLISEAGPHVPPNGFFDCTVEVLYGHMNVNNVYSLYVTDYSKNDALTPVQGSWCPPNLADRILKVEMWQPASAMGPLMQTGDYWSIRNNRMKISNGGYLEGTVSDTKMRQLEDTDSDPHLRALLERKKEWQASASAVTTAFSHQLIEEVREQDFFSCTIELLHLCHQSENEAIVYVTDYTIHPGLTSSHPDEPWSKGLEGRIVKALLSDRQAETAKNMQVGSFYLINNLRIKKSKTGNGFRGFLGGQESLIHMLNPNSPANENLKKLLLRKKRWQEAQTNTSQGSVTTVRPISLKKRRNCVTIKNILEEQLCPNKFRMMAHIINLWPPNPKDFIQLRCSNCQKFILPPRKSCFDCVDIGHEYVEYLFCFFIRVKDEEGSELELAISEECKLLGGLKPTDLYEDPMLLDGLMARLKPFLGNLFDVVEAWQRNQNMIPDTPLLRFAIDSWEAETPTGHRRLYGLVDCDSAYE